MSTTASSISSPSWEASFAGCISADAHDYRMTQATVGEICRAREWVEALAAQHKGVRVVYLLCRMIRDAGEECLPAR